MRKLAIIGAGPAGMFMLKALIDHAFTDTEIAIFEKQQTPGQGMPYSELGAGPEHFTNVSGNEIPDLATSVKDWISRAPEDLLTKFNIDRENFSDYRVMPRLLFGRYLADQFRFLMDEARKKRLSVELRTNQDVCCIRPETDGKFVVECENVEEIFDSVVISTGHFWPKTQEGKTKDWFDSPYPPEKLRLRVNGAVAIKGASLTAIDAVKTIARANGNFLESDGVLRFETHPDSPDFRIVLHTRNGLLPAVRFHLEDPKLSQQRMIAQEEIDAIKKENGGFLPLDLVYERCFIEPLQDKDPELHAMISRLSMEEFVQLALEEREERDPFDLLDLEIAEAKRSIQKHESVYWKELLAMLSFAMNYPAKHFSAEDMLRLTRVLHPLISVVIAFVPQSSCRELLALHHAGLLDLEGVGENASFEPSPSGGVRVDGPMGAENFKMFVDCSGQPKLGLQDFPFPDLVDNGLVKQATLAFKENSVGAWEKESDNDNVFEQNGRFFLEVPGIAVNDAFQVIGQNGTGNPNLYLMAVPYMGGYNPDYSGLDFGEEASGRIASAMAGEFVFPA